MRIELHIERLVLEGVALGSAEAERVRGAVARELQRALASAMPTDEFLQSRALRWVGTPPLTLHAGECPESLGRHIAGCILGGISGTAAKAPAPRPSVAAVSSMPLLPDDRGNRSPT